MARGLSREFDVQVLTTHPHYPDWKFAQQAPPWRYRESHGDVAVSRLRHYLPQNANGATRILSEATFAARSALAHGKRADVIICVTPGLLPVATGRALASLWDVPLGVVVQDLYSRAFSELGMFGGKLDRAVHLLEEKLLQSADGVAAIHEKMAETITTQYGVGRDNLVTIPNWSHVGSPSVDPSSVRDAFGWRQDEVIVLHAGNMGAKQGLEHVIQAVKATDRSRSLRFVMMGNGSRRKALEQAARGVSGVEIIDGVQGEDFMNVLAAADVLLLHERPGLQEMCAPSKLTSYFAAGRPVLAVTEQNSAAAMEMRASGAGLVVRPGSHADYINAAVALSESDTAQFVAGAREYAATALNESTALDRYREWVGGLVNAKGTAARSIASK